MRRFLLAAVLALLASPLAAQSTKVLNPDTGLPVFSAANPAPVTVVSNSATGTSAAQVQGNAAASATATQNPVVGGCVYSATPPTLTDGKQYYTPCDTRDNIKVSLSGINSIGGVAVAASNADGGAVSASNALLGLGLVFNGTTIDRMRGDTNAVSVSPTGLSSTYWRYTSGTSPILSNTTTAVTIKAASGASVKTYLDSCEIGSTALGASVPFAFRDGAAGTVMFAVRPPTAGWLTPFVVHFSPPLVGTANTLMEVVTTTADTSGTFDVNCQGHTGS